MSDNTVKLGLMPPLTGLVEMYGAEITRAGQIACAEVNASGGVLGRPLELVIEDDGSLPESAVAAANKLVDQHCVAIIGNLLSNSRIAVAYQVAEPRRIPYLNFSFYEGSILSRYFFHFAALPNQQIDKMIPYMRDKFGPRMFFAGNNYEWPRGSIDAAKRVLNRSGGEVVGEEYCPIGVSAGEIERLLDQVEKAAPDVFVPYFAGIDQVHLLTRFTERGLKNRMAVVMGHYDEIMASSLPPEVRDGFYSSNTYFMTLDSPENRSYLTRLSALPGVTGIWPHGNGILTNFGEGTYLCVKAFALAANQAGSLDAEALVNALESSGVTGPQGAVQMDPATHHARVNTYLSRCQADGTFSIVEKFGAIAPILPERYRHLHISQQPGLNEDIRFQARMLEQMAEAIFLVRASDGAIIYCNAGVGRMFGYSSSDLYEKHFSVILDPSGSTPEAAAAIGDSVLEKGVWEGETRNKTRDGSILWCAVSVSAFTHPQHGEVWMMSIRNITVRKQAEARIQKLTRLFDTLSQTNRTIVHATSREELYCRICESAVTHGKFVMAWVGLVDEPTHMVKPACHFGAEDGYLTNLVISVDDVPEGRGPTGAAIRENRVIYVNDYGADERTLPWREAALQRGFHGASGLPLRFMGKAIGALTLYAEEADFFDDEQLNLMEEMVIDIGFALDNFAHEAERKQAEQSLQESIVRLTTVTDNANDAIICLRPDGSIELWNKMAQQMFGYGAEEAIGKPVHHLITPERYRGKAGEGVRLFGQTGTGPVVGKTLELTALHRDGTEFPVELSISAMNIGGEWHATGIVRDITGRKQAEAQLAGQLDELRRWHDATLGREMRTLELKHEVNELLVKAGQPVRYPSAEADDKGNSLV